MEQNLFQPIDPGRKSPASLAVSIAVHVCAALLILLAPVAMVSRIATPKQTITYLAPKPVEAYRPKKLEPPKPLAKPLIAPPISKLAAKVPEIQQITPPKPAPLSLESPRISAPEPVVAAHIEPAPPRPVVKTDVFSATLAANPAPRSPAREIKTDAFGGQTATLAPKSQDRAVQTGGFGDPKGAAPSRNSSGKGVILASFGSADLPPGGGGRAGRQVIASAGFGGGSPVAGEGGVGPGRGQVRSSGFGETQLAAAPPKREMPAGNHNTQVEILTKPKPVYTAEAKELKIEGQVALEVQFNAAGSVRVVRVLKGLGHGLDEAAQQAAAQIRFRPATRDGEAIDSTNRVYIVFQLS